MPIISGSTLTILAVFKIAPELLVFAPELLVVAPEQLTVAPERLVVAPELLVVAPEELHEEVEAGGVALLLARLLREAQHLLSHLKEEEEDKDENGTKKKDVRRRRSRRRLMRTWQTLCSSGILRSSSPNLLGMSG